MKGMNTNRVLLKATDNGFAPSHLQGSDGIMATARDTVISTPELLEQTLSHLPMRDLLAVAPLVSRTWQAIALSPELQSTIRC
jgi:hypothetical protein